MRSTLLSLALALGISGTIFNGSAHAATDTEYNTNDLLLFFQNPTGSVGSTDMVLFSLGSTWDLFRDAATPGDPNYGQTVSLGNIGSTLNATFGSDWTSQADTIFAGAVGQKGSTNPAATSLSNADYARTVYITKPRSGQGSAGQSNSTVPTLDPVDTSIASAISSSNAVLLTQTNPLTIGNSLTSIDDQNPFSPTPTTPGLAYTAIQQGVQGPLSSSTYSIGSVSGIVLALDLYRSTPVANNASSWETLNSISGVSNGAGYYLGTITIGSNGDVNFVAIPEPSTALLALGGAVTAAFLARRRRQTSTVQ